ncbi:2-phosphosulfolactate phosphatase [Caldalkalibacillus salinus]|uniref:2-phosphosulfolactate phosphatase n=1 Tax=Caldalkalibacillus salinus TaxID=2803787 RepID=UPI0019249D7E|nr:2-phosphosulfolactate phosphatase [Caldalkalibacillus salinus]
MGSLQYVRGVEEDVKVDVALSLSYMKQEDIQKKTIVVIDALRATTTILTALHAGAAKVIPVETVGQALQYKCTPDTILIGERHSVKINGFHLGNSPREVLGVDWKDKTVVITTSNGTKALQKSKKAAYVLVGGFVNAYHCMCEAVEKKKDILFVCAGRKGEFAIEDTLAAGLMIKYLKTLKPTVELSDTALFAGNFFNTDDIHGRLAKLVAQGGTGQRLIKTGQKSDIDLCLDCDKFEFTGLYQHGYITSTHKPTSLKT